LVERLSAEERADWEVVLAAWEATASTQEQLLAGLEQAQDVESEFLSEQDSIVKELFVGVTRRDLPARTAAAEAIHDTMTGFVARLDRDRADRLARLGLARMDDQTGTLLDARKHEVIMMGAVDDPNRDDTVEELECGIVLNGKVVRKSQVRRLQYREGGGGHASSAGVYRGTIHTPGQNRG